MRYILKRRKTLLTVVLGTANAAISEIRNIRDLIGCGPNELAVCHNLQFLLAVSGGNADGADTFRIVQLIGEVTPGVTKHNIWWETIAAATLLDTYFVMHSLPGADSKTESRASAVALYPGETLWFSATAGGAGVVYQINTYGEWFIYEPVQEQPGQETPVSSPIEIPQRAGWWQ